MENRTLNKNGIKYQQLEILPNKVIIIYNHLIYFKSEKVSLTFKKYNTRYMLSSLVHLLTSSSGLKTCAIELIGRFVLAVGCSLLFYK